MKDKTSAFIGDISFNGLISFQPFQNKERYRVISNCLQEIDFVYANLESPVKSGNQVNEVKNAVYWSDREVTKALLKELNIKCASLANNHIYDYKMDGLQATISLLDELGILYTGAGWKKEHIEPAILNYDNYKAGFLAFVDISTNPGTQLYPELLINYFDLDKVINEVKVLKTKVDFVICSIHWGKDYSYYPLPYQKEVAERLTDEGVDIIMGHHPHTTQPYQVFKESYVFYSLGGLTYGDDFINGSFRSLPRRTKRSFIPVFAGKKLLKYIGTRELPWNRIIIEDWDVTKWSGYRLNIMHITSRFKTLRLFFGIVEKYQLKVYEFFFGYYRWLSPKAIRSKIDVRQ